ncbi:MAG TPA: Crp/Fnr family transcriptional regulator [Chitinophaga sp.]|uniref:Crp/Fnr family transcriptional regulator n=1 Tax=Chitinophaga sp. TaxID=1869181 RepID=UPI002DBE803F|nr:Crp/Fnr family transcriptional regulator [Chitinophaga sp.]HEU4554775.1 Crp/Fnr family transcriptional regulator [Chitinophaga sp.]
MSTDPYDVLKQHLQSRVPLTDDECTTLLSVFRLKKVKRRQFIIQPEYVAKYRSYVVKGALRAYVVNEEGEDHTIQFAVEDWWISDYNSYIYQQPATMFVTAIEDSTILQIDFESESRMKAASHKFETLFRIMAERAAAFQQRRIISSLTQSAKERYNEFAARYPNVVNRLPQYALASYLGMTTAFLSKIRNNKV